MNPTDLERSPFEDLPAYRYIRAADRLPTYAQVRGQPNSAIPAKVKLFNPTGAGTWFVAAYDPGDRVAWGLSDLGQGPEEGSFSMQELVDFRGRMGLPIERDLHYEPRMLAALLRGTPPASGGGAPAGPVIEGEQFAPGYTPEAAAYERATRAEGGIAPLAEGVARGKGAEARARELARQRAAEPARDPLAALIERQREVTYRPEYRAGVSDAEVLGVIVAHHEDWDGQQIVESFASALEDANFHTFREKVLDLWRQERERTAGSSARAAEQQGGLEAGG